MTASRAGSDPAEGSGTRTEGVSRQPGHRPTVRRALGLTTLSALFPGSGLLLTTRRRLGAVIVVLAALALLFVGGYALTNGLTTTVLQTASDTNRLQTVAVLLVLGTVAWVGAVALTATVTSPRGSTRGQRVGLLAFTALLCVAVSAPAAVGVRYISAHVGAVDRVFSEGSDVGQSSSPGGASVVGDDPDDPFKDQPRVNVLLLGSDANDARDGTRPDTMIVASIDTRTGDSVLFSIPRNLQQVPIPRENPLHNVHGSSFSCGNECLMNGIWTEAELVAEENPGWYNDDPNPGQTATREVISTILGLPIHHTVIANMEGFADLVDAMGGVQVTVQEEIPIGGFTYTDAAGRLLLDPNSDFEVLEPGTQLLDGPQALAYSRSRVTSDDFSRMRRQRCVVAAVVDQVNPMTMLQRYPQIISAVGDNVVTDLPQEDLDEWAQLVLDMQRGTMSSLPFTASNVDTVDPNYSGIRFQVYEALFAEPEPEPEPVEEAAATTEPEPEDIPAEDELGQDELGEDEVSPEEPSEEPTDELEDIGAVCN